MAWLVVLIRECGDDSAIRCRNEFISLGCIPQNNLLKQVNYLTSSLVMRRDMSSEKNRTDIRALPYMTQ